MSENSCSKHVYWNKCYKLWFLYKLRKKAKFVFKESGSVQVKLSKGSFRKYGKSSRDKEDLRQGKCHVQLVSRVMPSTISDEVYILSSNIHMAYPIITECL